MNLLPAPFPIHDFLNERELRHVMRLFGMGGLSYGNLSARRDEETFWMSASGVNKGQLNEIGRDILLVTDHDPDANAMVLSVPPDVYPFEQDRIPRPDEELNESAEAQARNREWLRANVDV
jgi:hypothetical protein